MTEWINVKDRLPDDGQMVLTYRPEAEANGFKPYTVETYRGGIFLGATPYNGQVIYWMPIPDAPREDYDDRADRR